MVSDSANTLSVGRTHVLMQPLLSRLKVRPFTPCTSNSWLVFLVHDTSTGEREVNSSEALLRSFEDTVVQDDLVEGVQLGAIREGTDLFPSTERCLQLLYGGIDQRLRPQPVNDHVAFRSPLADLGIA